VKKIAALLFVLVFTLASGAQPPTGKQNYFAIGLFTSAHSSTITYAIVSFQNGEMVGARIMSEQQFMYEIMGHYPSIANPEKKNLLYYNGVDSCMLIRNDFDKVAGYYAKPFYSLWKIRFYEHPMEFDNRGWSQGRIKPSLYQAQLLQQEYGVNNVLTEYIYGDSLFKLLRNVQDPAWVTTYRFVGPDTTGTGTDTTQTNNGNP
jgi:hypothetical protein